MSGRCCALKIRPKDNRRLNLLNIQAEFLFYSFSIVKIHELSHPLYRRQ